MLGIPRFSMRRFRFCGWMGMPPRNQRETRPRGKWQAEVSEKFLQAKLRVSGGFCLLLGFFIRSLLIKVSLIIDNWGGRGGGRVLFSGGEEYFSTLFTRNLTGNPSWDPPAKL